MFHLLPSIPKFSEIRGRPKRVFWTRRGLVNRDGATVAFARPPVRDAAAHARGRAWAVRIVTFIFNHIYDNIYTILVILWLVTKSQLHDKHFPNLTVFNFSSWTVQVELFNGYILIIPVNDCCATILGPATPVHADARILLPAWSTTNAVKAWT